MGCSGCGHKYIPAASRAPLRIVPVRRVRVNGRRFVGAAFRQPKPVIPPIDNSTQDKPSTDSESGVKNSTPASDEG